MSVWLCMPSKRPPEEVEPILKLWSEQGYKIAIQRDEQEKAQFNWLTTWPSVQSVFWRAYQGYADAVNFTSKIILRDNPDCDWIVCAGDDTEPDANHTAEEIAKQCSEHFSSAQPNYVDHHRGFMLLPSPTLGVMQPTGDKWGSNNRKDAHTFTARAIEPMHLCSSCGHPKDNARHMVGSYIDRVAGSPWMGREWCRRANQGKGPLWPQFTHMFGDQCLRDVAVMLGVYWERPDLVHLHKHWGRVSGDLGIAGVERMPEFLKRWNTTEHWNESKAIYERLKSNGFKECLPL